MLVTPTKTYFFTPSLLVLFLLSSRGPSLTCWNEDRPEKGETTARQKKLLSLDVLTHIIIFILITLYEASSASGIVDPWLPLRSKLSSHSKQETFPLEFRYDRRVGPMPRARLLGHSSISKYQQARRILFRS